MAGSREAIEKMEEEKEPRYLVITSDVDAAYEIVKASNHVYMAFKVKCRKLTFDFLRIFDTCCRGQCIAPLLSEVDWLFES